MDFNNFLVASKWDILKFLAEKPASPLEIAEKLGTTVSYVSQQLKILDAAGLILKHKTGFIEKGKPRNLFTIKKDIAYVAMLTEGFGSQNSLSITPEKECVLKSWIVGDSSLHISSANLFLNLSPFYMDIDGIFIDNRKFSKIFFVTEKNNIKSKINPLVNKFLPKASFSFYSVESFKNVYSEALIPLYVTKGFFKKLKGGLGLE